MNKSNNAISIIVRLVSVILLLTLLFGVIGIVYTFIGNGQRNFYVKYGNEILASEKKNMEFDKNAVQVFQCGTLTGHSVDYELQVFLNIEMIGNFDYYVVGERKDLKTDLSKYDCAVLFSPVKFESGFYISVPPDLTLQNVIQLKYPDKEVTGIPEISLQAQNSFILTITDSMEKQKTQIYFC